MFASDGMRPDLVEKYAKAGAMPIYKNLMKDGVTWLRTGCSKRSRPTPASAGTRWPRAPIRRSTARRTTRSSAPATRSPTEHRSPALASSRPTRLRMQRNARGKRSHRSTGWAEAAANIDGPTVDFAFVLLEPRCPRRPAERGRAGRRAVLRDHGQRGRVGRDRRRGGGNVPNRRPGRDPEAGDVDDPVVVRGVRIRLAPTTSTSTTASPAAASTTTAPSSARSARPAQPRSGRSRGRRLQGAEAHRRQRAHRRPRQPDRRPLHQVDLALRRRQRSSSSTRLPSPARSRGCGTPCAGLPAGGAGEDRLEKYIADNLPPWSAADFSPLEAGVDRRGHVRRAGPRP